MYYFLGYIIIGFIVISVLAILDEENTRLFTEIITEETKEFSFAVMIWIIYILSGTFPSKLNIHAYKNLKNERKLRAIEADYRETLKLIEYSGDIND